MNAQCIHLTDNDNHNTTSKYRPKLTSFSTSVAQDPFVLIAVFAPALVRICPHKMSVIEFG